MLCSCRLNGLHTWVGESIFYIGLPLLKSQTFTSSLRAGKCEEKYINGIELKNNFLHMVGKKILFYTILGVKNKKYTYSPT